MPKHPRGILGVPKDPSRQILFSFHARDGEEWPSDEEDSDYSPGFDSDSDRERKSAKQINKKRKSNTQKIKNSSPKKRKSSTVLSTVGTSQANSPAIVPSLPPELWYRIFQMIVRQEGALPFLQRAQKVCPQWAHLATQPELWERVDMSLGIYNGWRKLTHAGFTRFCQSRLSACKHLNLSNCVFMSKPWAVKAIQDHCTQLESLNLSHCNKLPNGSLEQLFQHLTHLRDVDLSATTSDAVSIKTLSVLTLTCAEQLTRISLADNRLVSVQRLAECFKECKYLQHLDLSNSKLSMQTVNIEHLQQTFPQLKTLYLSNTSIAALDVTLDVETASAGFPHLEELSVACTDSSMISQSFIWRMLKGSTKLRLLDMRGCTQNHVVNALTNIPATDVEQLYLGRSQARSCRELEMIIRKWQHSLTDLDLSGMTFPDQELADNLAALLPAGGSNDRLHTLNLSGTNVTMHTLRSLLPKLPNLRELWLSSCRELERGCKRDYKTPAEIRELQTSL
ncbi:F-box/LRR-repeat protein 6-like [Dreissena polymorpha]|uniref:F-box/LRR-repeat protein 6-like n=1 Tax=Dreissena polymorpha TaxID=45954 RepID=UPI002263B94F|nr:F-box/LRR-repeat protein 6-like [Dreissena polymorpha]XP_052215608.1 F-box/LRR-repeat protein 6-like [Dreissena polymorpha]